MFSESYLLTIVLGQSINFAEALSFSASKSADILYLLLTSILIRFLLEISGQRWIRTFSQTATLIILPIVTYIITSVIAGNIALSLGMVGALSIVRFRNPVRSPFELSVHFAAITMGIATATDINWLILIIFSMFFIAIFIKIYSKVYKKLSRTELFNSSFTEGNTISTLEITTKKDIKILDESELLKSKSSKNNIFNYLLASGDFNLLKDKLSEIDEFNDEIISYQLNE